jgi:hypothetical protein
MDWAVSPAREPAKNRIPVDDELFVKKIDHELWNSFWHVSKTTYSGLSVFKKCFHCSCAVNWMAAYGTIRAMVAEFPRHKLSKPETKITKRELRHMFES